MDGWDAAGAAGVGVGDADKTCSVRKGGKGECGGEGAMFSCCGLEISTGTHMGTTVSACAVGTPEPTRGWNDALGARQPATSHGVKPHIWLVGHRKYGAKAMEESEKKTSWGMSECGSRIVDESGDAPSSKGGSCAATSYRM